MNLILLFPDDFLDARHVRLTDRRYQHVISVHRAEVGSSLRVGLLNDQLGSGIVTALTDAAVELAVTLEQPPPPALPLTLLVALPRPKVLKRIVQCAAAMGVKRIYVMHTWRVEKSFWQSPALTETALRKQLLLGLEQAGDTILPEINLCRRFKPFVEDELPALSAGSLALVAHPAAAEPCPRGVSQPVTLAIGPEGGFIAYEIESLRAQGFTAVTAGPRRLRVEEVVPALIGRLF